MENTSANAWAIAAPIGPRWGTSMIATTRSSANEAAYTTRSHPVLPTMIRTNPAAPTLTFTVWPISRTRSHAAPVS